MLFTCEDFHVLKYAQLRRADPWKSANRNDLSSPAAIVQVKQPCRRKKEEEEEVMSLYRDVFVFFPNLLSVNLQSVCH